MVNQRIFNLVNYHFEQDNAKTYEWFNSIIPLYGKTPLSMLRSNQKDVLLRYILKRLDEGKL